MDVKYQVFVSSTFKDLEEERRAVIEAILNLGHIPVGMEAFQASDDTQWDYIKRRIDESDYYVVIVGERYGSEEKGKSYTQMEYEYAVENSVPVAAFLLAPDARKTWPSEKVEFEKKQKVEKFRKLCEKKLVKYWNNADQLGGRVALALGELMRQKPRTGWVRADTLPSSSVIEELTRLSQEKRDLQDAVERLSADSQRVRIPPETLWKIQKLSEMTIEDVTHIPRGDAPTTMLSLFLDLDDKLTSGSDHYDLNEYIQDIHGYDFDETAIYLLMNEFAKVNIVAQTWSTQRGARLRWYAMTNTGKDFLMHSQIWLQENPPSIADEV
jgi:hypothetical protein